ncbi:MAG TPA: hypothetical protein VMZ28_06010 [Kofleriaceae bacterium]|nr:hypothetical protein [Kofleriaceae bacterium]
MSKRNDKQNKTRLKVKKEILRNLSVEDLAAAAGGMMQSDPPGPCPRSKQSC